MPMGKYKDMKDCMMKNKDKDDPGAYCATIMRKMEGEKKEKLHFEYQVPIHYVVETFNGNKEFIVKGIAIEATTSRNGVTYVPEELRKAAPTLVGKPVLKDHVNKVDNIVGIVIDSSFNEMTSQMPFSARIMDRSVQEKISDGRLRHVSIGAGVKNFREEAGNNGETLAIAEGLDIYELSFTPVPGVPGATLTQALAESYQKFKQENETIRELFEVKEEMVEETKKEEIKETIKVSEQNNETITALAALKEELSSLKNKLAEKEKKELAEEKVITKSIIPETTISEESSDEFVVEHVDGGIALWKKR